jgi:hypothetical protein
LSRLFWDAREYDTGVDRGVFFPSASVAEVWDGLVSVTENTPFIEGRVRYVDGVKTANPGREDNFSATVSAFTYPDSFLMHPRSPFGMSYRVRTADSYKIHVIYNALAHMTDRSYGQSDSTPLQFDLTTQSTAIFESKPASHLVIDGSAAPRALEAFENMLYGSDGVDPRLPTPQEIVDVFDINAIFKITDNGDGTFTIDGPDEAINWLDGTTFMLNWPKIVFIDSETYNIRSW